MGSSCVCAEQLGWLGAEYVHRYAKQELLGEVGKGEDDDMGESDGFLSSSDDEDQPAGVAEIS